MGVIGRPQRDAPLIVPAPPAEPVLHEPSPRSPEPELVPARRTEDLVEREATHG